MDKTPPLKMFEDALAIKDPWKIDDISFKTSGNNEPELHVFLSYQQSAKFIDSTGTPCPVHSTYDKTWQHIDFEKQNCYIHCKAPRIKTTEGTILTLDVPWARTGSRFSWAFEANIMQEIKNGKPFDKIGSQRGKTSPRILTIFNEWVKTAYEDDVIDKDLSTIGIDEISDQEKEKQITITIDLKNERVLHVSQSTGKEALKDVCSYLASKNISPNQIKHLSGPLLNGSHHPANFFEDVKTYFPNAKYLVDRLYIVKMLNDAMNQISKKEKQRTKKLAEECALFTKNPAELSTEQKVIIQELSTKFPNMSLAYQLKNEFFALWNQTSQQTAEAFLESWCQKVNKTKLSPLKHAAKLLKTHKQYIVHFSKLPTNSAVMEKTHENIRAATSRTKGLKNLENVSNMIYFCCGKLTFSYIES